MPTQQPTARYDETLGKDGTRLPAWQALLEQINALSPEQLERRQQDIVRQLRANGLAYKPQTSESADTRPWELDLMPMLLEPADWSSLSQGLQQRARLKEALLSDIYGEQKLLKERLLAPSMVYSHSSYLRDMVGAGLPNELPLYSADVSRSPSGDWQVVDDICQYPAGIGYALENRLVLSRVLPHAFKDSRVQRVAPYFRQLQNFVLSASKNNTRCVMLGYGVSHTHYFEFAWLAKYLGYILVELGDLTIRNDQVFLKTVAGLQQVDVILRFVNDIDLDSLAMGQTKTSGIPGLFQAARIGGVKIINPIGSGVLDNPAFNTCLPDLCKVLLDEDLLLLAAPTYWLGDAEQHAHVLSRSDELLFRHIDATGQLLDPLLMTPHEKNVLISRIQQAPHQFVAQERVDRSVAPALSGQQRLQRQITVRAYLVRTETGYQPMSGGLCLLDDIKGGRRPPFDALSGSKDVWALSHEAVKADSLLRNHEEDVAYAMVEGELPSRIAENLFWLGRNAERAETAVRLLRSICQNLLNEEASVADNLASPAIIALLKATTAATGTVPGFIGRGGKRRLAQPDKELLSLLHDLQRKGSLPETLQQLRGSADSVLDRVSSELLNVLNTIDDLKHVFAMRADSRIFCNDADALNQTTDLLDETLIALSALSGLTHENITHGDSWRFMMLGRWLERAHQTLVIVNAMLSSDRDDDRLLEYLLRQFDSVMTYRSRYRSGLDMRLVLQLLLLDEVNPRSLAFQFKKIQETVVQLPGRRNTLQSDPLNRLAIAGLSRVRLADTHELLHGNRDARQNLSKFLSVLQDIPAAMAEKLNAQYFSHIELRQRLGQEKPDGAGVLRS